MHIDHVALWTSRLEHLRSFYETYFGAEAGEKYVNAKKQFESYFLRFPSGARLEIMQSARVRGAPGEGPDPAHGYAHVAISLGSTDAVDTLSRRMRAGGIQVVDGPRWTGDGYYEAVALDPDGNRVEITV